MKHLMILAAGFAIAGLAAVTLASASHAAAHGEAPLVSSEPVSEAGLVWRCGRNNPASWGTFGNGCLKQKRKAKSSSAAIAVPQPGLAAPQN